MATRTSVNATRIDASWAAPVVLSMLSQTSKIPAVRVGTAKKSMVPNSFNVSISASATPTAIDGRASGAATVKKLARGVRPRVRLASNSPKLCSMNAARARR